MYSIGFVTALVIALVLQLFAGIPKNSGEWAVTFSLCVILALAWPAATLLLFVWACWIGLKVIYPIIKGWFITQRK
jgi:hypothetical protein